MKFLLIAFLWVTVLPLLAQRPAAVQLIQALGNRDKINLRQADSLLVNAYNGTSDAERKQLLDFYTSHAASDDPYTTARCCIWQGIIHLRPPFTNSVKAFDCMQRAIKKAIESGDEYLMVSCFEIYALNCMSMGKPEISLFYFLKSGEIRKRTGDRYFATSNAGFYGQVGDLLYKMQEYEQAIQYITLAMKDTAVQFKSHMISMNTLGLAYQRLGKTDSALYWYNKAMEAAVVNKQQVWEGIIKGNTGALYFDMQAYEKALPLLWQDYNSSIVSEQNNAGNTLHRIALTLLKTGKTDSALLLARKSFDILLANSVHNPQYIKNASFSLSEVFRKKGMADSAFYYADIYHHLNDSINRSVASNRLDVVRTKLDFEKLSGDINILLAEKQAEKTRRNFLLAGIVLLLVIAWFYVRWQRQQYLNKQQQLQHQQQMTETEMANARDKLEEFTRHLIEKNQLIETLQMQLVQQNQSVNEELQHQSILTENDWLRFKEMFEKANPGFMNQLQMAAPGITTAELRLAALLRLNLGNKHIASMLGVGTDAVRKTKSRLRQRLQITVEDGLEDYIKTLSSFN